MKKKYLMKTGVVIILFAIFIKNILQFLAPSPTGVSPVFTTNDFLYSRFYFWGMVIFVYLYAHYIEKQNLLLKKSSHKGIRFYLLSIVGITIAILIANLIAVLILKALGYPVNQHGEYLKNMLKVLRSHPILLLFTCITAGVTEEIIFRGYIQTRIELIFNSPILGIILSSIFFSLAHALYGTAVQVVVPFGIGLIFAIYYYKYRNIYVLIIFHFFFDYLQLLVSHG